MTTIANLNYTPNFIRQYFLNCGCCASHEDAYWMTEKQFTEEYKNEIKRGILRNYKFADYGSFKSSLSYHVKKHRHLIT